MDGFPAPKEYMNCVRRLHIGARYVITFYEQDLLDGMVESEMENMRFDGFRAYGSELTLHFTETDEITEDRDVTTD